MLFERLVEIKIRIGSRLHCIDIYDDDCNFTWMLLTHGLVIPDQFQVDYPQQDLKLSCVGLCTELEQRLSSI